MYGNYIKTTMESLLYLQNFDITSPDDFLIEENREKGYATIVALKNLVESLDNIDPPSYDMFAREFYEVMLEMFRMMRDKFTDDRGNPKITKMTEDNIAVVLMELDAAQFCKWFYFADRIMTQFFLMAMTDYFWLQQKSVDYGYSLRATEPASVDITFKLGSQHESAVVIPIGTEISIADNSIVFTTDDSTTIEPGAVSVTMKSRNQRGRTETHTVDGSPNIRLKMSSAPFIKSGSRVAINGDTSWLRVENFFDSGSTDKHYRLDVDESEFGYFVFGDGTNGLKPSGIADLTYFYGGGSLANTIQPRQISRISSTIFETLGSEVTDISCYNTYAPSGGKDRESIEEARINIPTFLKSSNRSITTEDFENNVLTVSGVRRALAIDRPRAIREGLPTTMKSNEVILYLVDDVAGTITESMKQEVIEFFNTIRKSFASVVVNPVSALYTLFDIDASVYFRDGVDPIPILNNVRESLRQYFKFDAKDPNGDYRVKWGMQDSKIARSKIIFVIEQYQNSGITRVVLNIPVVDMTISKLYIPKLRNVVLTPYNKDGIAIF